MFQSFIELTNHADSQPVIIPVAKITVIFPVPEIEQLAHGKSTIILDSGIRLGVAESFTEVKNKLMPVTH
jgi:hypothetical protein